MGTRRSETTESQQGAHFGGEVSICVWGLCVYVCVCVCVCARV